MKPFRRACTSTTRVQLNINEYEAAITTNSSELERRKRRVVNFNLEGEGCKEQVRGERKDVDENDNVHFFEGMKSSNSQISSAALFAASSC